MGYMYSPCRPCCGGLLCEGLGEVLANRTSAAPFGNHWLRLSYTTDNLDCLTNQTDLVLFYGSQGAGVSTFIRTGRGDGLEITATFEDVTETSPDIWQVRMTRLEIDENGETLILVWDVDEELFRVDSESTCIPEVDQCPLITRADINLALRIIPEAELLTISFQVSQETGLGGICDLMDRTDTLSFTLSTFRASTVFDGYAVRIVFGNAFCTLTLAFPSTTAIASNYILLVYTPVSNSINVGQVPDFMLGDYFVPFSTGPIGATASSCSSVGIIQEVTEL